MRAIHSGVQNRDDLPGAAVSTRPRARRADEDSALGKGWLARLILANAGDIRSADKRAQRVRVHFQREVRNRGKAPRQARVVHGKLVEQRVLRLCNTRALRLDGAHVQSALGLVRHAHTDNDTHISVSLRSRHQRAHIFARLRHCRRAVSLCPQEQREDNDRDAG